MPHAAGHAALMQCHAVSREGKRIPKAAGNGIGKPNSEATSHSQDQLTRGSLET